MSKEKVEHVVGPNRACDVLHERGGASYNYYTVVDADTQQTLSLFNTRDEAVEKAKKAVK